ncbi:MAG: ORF6N domain-containing protein [Planctomycetes bacterium]|nr:ORF6N domain-containing protein [Planctomycetota bacterium]
MSDKRRVDQLVIPEKQIEKSIRVVRGQRVVLDSDLARLYEVTTKSLNQAVKRNSERFPEDFAFQLTTRSWV